MSGPARDGRSLSILVVGAGAIGGYFGARLLEIGRDVTFLVRPRRAAQLLETGLVIRSPKGNVALPAPPTVLAEDLGRGAPFDIVLLACKAYDLDGAIASFASAIGPDTAVIPLLNGMRHLEVLEQRIGPDKVLGSWCQIAATLDEDGQILHLNDSHSLSFGERGGRRSPRVEALADAMRGATFEARASDAIVAEMWEKWIFLASLAAGTCLMRGSIGDIVEAGTEWVPLGLLEGCAAIAQEAGFPPSPAFLDRIRPLLTAPGSTLTASMLRDVERGAPTEADHVIGDLLARCRGELPPLLTLAHAHLKAYEARRRRLLRDA